MSEKPAPTYHHLFEPEDGVSSDDYAPEPIAAIYVSRLESTGKIRVPRRFLPDELRDLDAVFLRFGGGTYELEARRADGSIYAKRLRTLPGAPRPLIDPAIVPDAPPPGAAAAPAPAASGPLAGLSGVDPMILLILHMSDRQAQSQAAMLQAFVAAMAGKPAAPPPPQSSPAEMLGAMAAAMGALKPAPPPPPAPLEGVLALHKMIREEATAQNTAAVDLADRRAPVPAEMSAGEQLKSIVEAAIPIFSLLPAKPPTP